jgi:hypothetical protein
MDEPILGQRVANLLDELGYELRLRWRASPYPDAPRTHWSYRESFCESGPAARLWFEDWMFTFANTSPVVGGVHDISLSRRKVGEWEQ